FIIAFSMYSKVPMPKVEWTKDTMKYAICFFPLVGLVNAGLLVGWVSLSTLLRLNNIVFAAVATYIPILVTGGIHMDGFCDTVDARASNQSKERRLQILKDSNAGAFAVIKCGMYYLLCFAAFTQLSYDGIMILSLGYVLSRALSGLSIMNFKSARSDGLAATFKGTAHKKVVNIVLCAIAIYVCVGMVFINWRLGLVAILCAAIAVLYYYYFSNKEFGGVTGDLAGYFLQLCELYMAYGIIIMNGVFALWN
ncbi:MAG: adenosylcobinamide-GDP ribazoletransferase, partial [Oscillospiraceae bacterium]